MNKKAVLLWLLTSPAMASFSGFIYQRQLTINHTQVSTGTLTYTNFPVLFQDTDVTLSTSVSGGHLSNPDGYDLVFSTKSDCSFILNWDTETFNNTGSVQDNIWVNVPIISSAADTTFYMCYGNPLITTYQGISTATWDSNYVAVYHMGASTSTEANGNDSTTNNSVGTVGQAEYSNAGQIDGSASFPAAATGYITIGNSNETLQTLQLPMTIELWYYHISIPTPVQDSFIYSDNGGTNLTKCLDFDGGPSLVAIFSTAGCGSQNITYSGPGDPSTLFTWHYLFIVTSGTTSAPILSMALDGNAPQVFSPSSFQPMGCSGTSLSIGANTSGTNPFAGFHGFLDEMRFSSIARSNDWGLTSYNSQFSPSTFLIIGSESGGSPPTTHGIFILGSKVRISGGKIKTL